MSIIRKKKRIETIMKIGYACINTTIDAPVNKGMVKKTFLAKGLDCVSEIALQNITNLYRIVQWNHENNIKLYRITSCLFPWMTEYDFKDLKDYDEISEILRKTGQFAKDVGQRLSFHPDHFVNLSSPRPEVVKNSIADLEKHNEIADMLLFEQSLYNKINIHIGGAYGDKDAAIQRFIEHHSLLSDSLKSRLTIENDSKGSLFHILDLCYVSEQTGASIVLDIHHHRLHSNNITLKDAMELAFSTWDNITPIIHVSEGDSHAHNDYINNIVDTFGYDCDLMLEAKAKDKAVLHYVSLIKSKELVNVI